MRWWRRLRCALGRHSYAYWTDERFTPPGFVVYLGEYCVHCGHKAPPHAVKNWPYDAPTEARD